jgi:hypothetical protein
MKTQTSALPLAANIESSAPVKEHFNDALIGGTPGVQTEKTSGFEFLRERLEIALLKGGLQTLETQLGGDPSSQDLREAIENTINQFASAVQLRRDGYCQDFTNSLTLIMSQTESIPDYQEKNPAFAAKLMGRIEGTLEKLEDYSTYFSSRNPLTKNGTTLAACQAMESLGLTVTYEDFIGFLPSATKTRIDSLISELKELGTQLEKDGDTMPVSAHNIEITRKMFATIQSELEGREMFPPR